MGKCDKINLEVKQSSSVYQDLILLPKYASENTLRLEPEDRGRDSIGVGTVPFEHISSEAGYFRCRQNMIHLRSYSFQLFVKSFTADAIFRFESTGTRHNNPKNATLSLLERSVKTPHFQRFNEDGVIYAYRTEYIEENEEEILNDVNMGLREYCAECSLMVKSGPRLSILQQLNLFRFLPPEDPHNNVKFA